MLEMTSLACGASTLASRIALRLRIALSRSRSWSALVANESISVVTPQSSSSTQKSAGVMIGVSWPRTRKTSASIRMKSRLSWAAAAIRYVVLK